MTDAQQKNIKHLPVIEEFSTLGLKGKWKNKAGYIKSNGDIIEGVLSLDVYSCAFYLPKSKPSPYAPSAHIYFPINHKAPVPFQLKNDIITICSLDQEYRFIISEEHQESLQTWLNERLPALEKIRSFPDTFLDRSDYDNNDEHLFLAKHFNNELLSFLTKNFPVFVRPIPWYDGEVFFSTTNDKLFFSLKPDSYTNWTWTETANYIRVVNCIESYGFFDTSESEDYFSYTIRYLGESLNKEDQDFVDNEKLHDPLPSLPSHFKTQRFIAENPFGLNGFFEISWLVE